MLQHKNSLIELKLVWFIINFTLKCVINYYIENCILPDFLEAEMRETVWLLAEMQQHTLMSTYCRWGRDATLSMTTTPQLLTTSDLRLTHCDSIVTSQPGRSCSCSVDTYSEPLNCERKKKHFIFFSFFKFSSELLEMLANLNENFRHCSRKNVEFMHLKIICLFVKYFC